MKRFGMLFLFISLSAFAEKSLFDRNVENTTMLNPSCPVTLTGVYANPPGRSGALVSVHFVNQTDKRLIAVKVAIAGYDAAWDKHDFPEEYSVAVNLKPQKEAGPVWRIQKDQFALDTAGGAIVSLEKLVFSDGSTWRDDGTESCSLSIRGKAKPIRNSDGD
jgi:hypothetical protein